MKKTLLLLFSILVQTGYAQIKTGVQARLIAGPMLGYAEHTECLIWVQTAEAAQVAIHYRLHDGKGIWDRQVKNITNVENREPAITKFILKNLEMGSTYEYRIFINDREIKIGYPLYFKTKVLWEWRIPPPEFTFMVGSCFYVNDSAYDRPGKPYGGNTEILKSMYNTPADFMIWLGDNTYTREADYSSSSGIENRYLHTRKAADLQPFLAKMNHYAIWDDHDYGDNDANKSFELKQKSRKCFVDYWGNKTFGEDEEGIYSNFRYSDAEFFLLDDRWFRDESELNEEKIAKTQLGSKQISWLLDKLKHSRASFKFVVVGGQFINENTSKESFNIYKKERDVIVRFIIEQKISGVIFLSGDRHFTELLKNEKVTAELGYPLYDLTSSPITAGVVNPANSPEENNPQRISNTLVTENNYCTVKIIGPKPGERELTISCFDVKGMKKWVFSLSEKELKAK